MPPANTTGNPLSAASLSTLMVTSIPKDADPGIKNPYEAVALAAHAGFIAVGFRLIGLGEEHKIEAASSAQDPQPLPSEWNAHTSYEFRYAHTQSAMEYLLKISRMGGKAIVMGMGLGDDKTSTFEVVVKDYVSEGSLPVTFTSNSEASIEDKAKRIEDAFISAGRLNDFGALLKISIIQKLAPGLHKEGYEGTRQQERDAGNARNDDGPRHQGQPRRPPEEPEPARPYPVDDPLRQPRNPLGNRPLPEPIPGFEDEYEVNRPPGRSGLRGDRPYVPIGQNDLYPPGLGPNDPLRPHLGGGLGGGLRMPGGGMAGGMHPTFYDPMFGGGGGGQGGYNPMAPPGARYDPVGPGDPLRDNRGGRGGGGFPGGGGGFGGGFGGAGGRPPNPFGGFGDGDFI